MKFMISLGIETAYEFPTNLSLTLNCLFLSFLKFLYSSKSKGWKNCLLQLGHVAVLILNPSLSISDLVVSLLHILHKIFVLNRSVIFVYMFRIHKLYINVLV